MEQFGSLKRRTTDLMSSIPKPNVNMPSELPQFPKLADLSSRLPALPKLPAFGSYGSNNGAAQPAKQPTVKATWERIDVPPIPRSSHSINIIAGNAYIFGGEINPRQPVDNDMHVIVLPFSSAGADYYKVKAKAAPKPDPPKIPTVVEPTGDDDEDAGTEKELSEVPLASPSGAEGKGKGKGKEPAIPEPDVSLLGDVPAPRVGHATAVIGTRIFVFGGRGGPDMKPLEERGRVWVYDTKTHLWSYLDPYLPTTDPSTPAFADKRQHYPAARSYHAAAGVDQPREFFGNSHRPAARTAPGPGPGGRGLKRTTTWTEWAQGDSDVVGTPQRPIVGNVANNSRDEDDEGFGTFIVHGGCFDEGRANDTWAFDVHSRVWQEFPSAPGKPRGGTSISVAGGKLWRFGGFNGETEEGGQLDYLQLGVSDFNDMSGSGDVVLSAKGGGWKTIPADPPSANQGSTEDESAQEKQEQEEEATTTKPLTTEKPKPHWPGHRSVAGFQTVTMGGVGGREFLILAFGERDPSDNGHEAAGKFWNDMWAYELSRGPGAAASVLDAVSGWAAWGKSSITGDAIPEKQPEHNDHVEQGKWFKIEAEAYDDEDPPAVGEGPGPRGWFASAHMGELEERGIVFWGGVDGANRRLGDGWILRLGDEKREP